MGQLKLILVVFVSFALIEDAKCLDHHQCCSHHCYSTTTPTAYYCECNSRAVFLEDCPNLSDFKFLPKPADDSSEWGVHPKVCCPRVGVAVEEEKYKVSKVFST